MTTSTMNSIIVGAAITLSAGAVASAFNAYTDIALLKQRADAMEITVRKNAATSERLDTTLNVLDKNIAIQTETLKALKETVNRLEDVLLESRKPY